MKNHTTITVTCAGTDAVPFIAIGFTLEGQSTDGRVFLIHRRAYNEHVMALLLLSKLGVAYHGHDDGRTNAPASTFAAADGSIVCANLPGLADDPSRAAIYAARLDRAQELVATRCRKTGGSNAGR